MNSFINNLYSVVPCHRNPDRCCSLNGEKLKICSRCMAIYPMYIFLVPFMFIVTESNILTLLIVSICLMLPLIIDGGTQALDWRKSNNFLRITTGLLFGLGQSLLIAGASHYLITSFTVNMVLGGLL